MVEPEQSPEIPEFMQDLFNNFDKQCQCMSCKKQFAKSGNVVCPYCRSAIIFDLKGKKAVE